MRVHITDSNGKGVYAKIRNMIPYDAHSHDIREIVWESDSEHRRVANLLDCDSVWTMVHHGNEWFCGRRGTE